MADNLEQLIAVVQQQAELFLLDVGEFYPFGSYINSENVMIPVGVSLESDFPASTEVIRSLEEYFAKTDYKAAVIAVDVKVNKGEESFNALQIRLMSENDTRNIYFRYLVNDQQVHFQAVTL